MFYKIKTKPKILPKQHQGFSAIEYVVCAILIGIIFANVGKLVITIFNNPKLVQKVADANLLTLQKATELFNDSKNQVAKIPTNLSRIGSIDPNNPVDGYFDLFNESSCAIRKYTQSPPQKITIDNPKDSNTKIDGKLGDLGDDTGNAFTSLDCSTANYTKPSQSLEPKYRRQWLVVKDFPNKNDVTYSVAVVYLEKNQVIRIRTATKTDGAISR